MRFGIMAMQTGALLPAGLSAQEAMAHVASFDHAGHVRRLAAQGFNPIELGGDMILFFPNAFAPEPVDRLDLDGLLHRLCHCGRLLPAQRVGRDSFAVGLWNKKADGHTRRLKPLRSLVLFKRASGFMVLVAESKSSGRRCSFVTEQFHRRRHRWIVFKGESVPIGVGLHVRLDAIFLPIGV